MGRDQFVAWVRLVLLQMGRHDVMDRAAAVAFFTVFSVFPALLLVFAVLHLFGREALFRAVLPFLSTLMPEAPVEMIQRALEDVLFRRGSISTGIGLGAVGLLWAASMALSSLMHAIYRAYELPYHRPFWFTRLMALLVFLLLMAWGTLTLLVFLFYPLVIQVLPDLVRIPLVKIFPYLVGFLLVGGSAMILFYLAPPRRIALKYHLPGTVFFALSWLVGTRLYAFYVSQIAVYRAVYGALSGMIVGLMWAYLASLLLLIGAEVNSALLEVLGHPEKVGVQDPES